MDFVLLDSSHSVEDSVRMKLAQKSQMHVLKFHVSTSFFFLSVGHQVFFYAALNLLVPHIKHRVNELKLLLRISI